MAKHQHVLETWFQRVWAEADESAIDDMLVPDTRARGLGSHTRIGPEGFKEFHRCFLAMMEKCSVQIDKIMDSGNWTAVLCTFRAVRKDTGEPVEMMGQVMVRIEDEKLVEAYNHFDFMGLYQQLGLIPDGAFDGCLRGEKIA